MLYMRTPLLYCLAPSYFAYSLAYSLALTDASDFFQTAGASLNCLAA